MRETRHQERRMRKRNSRHTDEPTGKSRAPGRNIHDQQQRRREPDRPRVAARVHAETMLAHEIAPGTPLITENAPTDERDSYTHCSRPDQLRKDRDG